MNGDIRVMQQTDGSENILEDEAFSIKDFLYIFVRHWRIVCGVPFLAVVIGFVIFNLVPPTYTGTVSILIDPKSPGSLGPTTDFGSAILVDSGKLSGITAFILSRTCLEQVVKQERLYDDPEFAPVKKGILARWRSWFRGAPSAEKNVDEATTKQLQIDGSVERLEKAMSVVRNGLTYFITVSVNSRDPVKAARLAQVVSETFIKDQLQSKYEAADRATKWLEGHLVEVRKELLRSEEAVTAVRQAYGLAAIDGMGAATVFNQQVSELNAAISAAETQLSLKEAKVEQARKLRSSGGNIESLPEVMASSVIVSLRNQQSEIKRKLAEFTAIGTILPNAPRHPEVLRLEEALRSTDNLISQEISRITDNLENDAAALRNNVTSLREQLKKLTGIVDPAGLAKLREAQSVADANRQTYTSLLNKLNDLEQSKTIQESEARIVEKAHVPVEPSFPLLPIFLLGSLGPGVLLGIGGAFAVDYFRSDRMKASAFVTPVQIEKTFSLPVLASVPLLQVDDSEEAEQHVDIFRYLVANQFSQFAESLRFVLYGLQQPFRDKPGKVIQITSSIAGEGKTTLGAMLALSSALAGTRVILIDCDFRRPAASKLFNLSKSKGLIDLLSGTAEWDEVINQTPYPSLKIISAGTCDENSFNLIGSKKMTDVVKFAAQNCDLVYLDTPPILPVMDATIISNIVDKTIFLVEWNNTDKDLVIQALDRLNRNNSRITGIVLNKVNLDSITTYGYNYSKYFSEIGKYYNYESRQSGALKKVPPSKWTSPSRTSPHLHA